MKSRIARMKDPVTGELKYYDLGTSNKSFLSVAWQLKTLGIKNFYFLLEIKDLSLISIDPYQHDPNNIDRSTLSRDQVTRIINEIVVNPWYYLREISRIPDPGGDPIPYLANRGNIAQAWAIIHNLDSWLTIPRQTGKTQSALAIENWIYGFATNNAKFTFLNKSGEDSDENLRRLKTQTSFLPEYLRFEYIIDEETGKKVKKRDNARRITNPVNQNEIVTKAKASSYDSALTLARGTSTPIVHSDETEFTDWIDVIVSNSYPAFKKSHDRSIANGAPSCRIFTSTPGDSSTKAGAASQKILDKTLPWTEKLYDWSPSKIEDYINSQGVDCNRIFYIEYTWKELGLSRKWYEEMKSGMDPISFRRDILLQRIAGSTLSPYSQEDLEAIVQLQHNPIDEVWLLDFFKFDIYKQIDPRRPYIVGIDCATGTNKDNNAITVLDPYTLEPVAEFKCSFIGETLFEKLIIEMVEKMIPRACLCIERNSMGDGIIDHLLHSRIAGRLYYDKSLNLMKDNMDKFETQESMLKKQASMKTYYGVYTNGQSRDTMFSILHRHVYEYKDKFITKNITTDLTRLVQTASGKIVAGTGKDEDGESFHDDSIMSYLIALYVRYHGNNLPIFGIYIGSEEIENQNKGLKHPNEINPELVSPDLIKMVSENETKEMRQKAYQEMLRKTTMDAQQQSLKLYKAGLIKDSIYNDTPESILDETDVYEDTGGSIKLSLFDELNNFNNFNNNGFNNGPNNPYNPW